MAHETGEVVLFKVSDGKEIRYHGMSDPLSTPAEIKENQLQSNTIADLVQLLREARVPSASNLRREDGAFYINEQLWVLPLHPEEEQEFWSSLLIV